MRRSFIAVSVIVFAALGLSGCSTATATAVSYDGPIIDMHLHTDPPESSRTMPNPASGAPSVQPGAALMNATVAEMDRHNIVLGVLNGYPGTLASWMQAHPQRFLAAIMPFRDSATPILDAETLRGQLESGEATAVGEIVAQYVGLAPADPALEPFWRVAEETGAPVLLHIGTSFPGTAYSGYPAFRLALGNPMLLEEVLVRHPRLRIWLAHGGAAWVQETFDLMQQYPQVYLDISTVSWIGGEAGRAGFHAFLREAIARGFGKRIMFGSDQMAWPDAIGLAVAAVDSASFLTPEQKRDIFHDNAARFLRLAD